MATSQDFVNWVCGDHLLPEYLQFLLVAQGSELFKFSSGSVHQTIYFPEAKAFHICHPSVSTQKEICDYLSAIKVASSELASNYQWKLNDLTELKQSILQKAFAGELTAGSVVAFPKPSTTDESVDTNSPEFTANVICLSQYLHAKQDRDKTFGRVKAEKTQHLTESIGRIPLGRNAYKGAHGPNDSAHMRGAENWAKEKKFFEFVKRPEGKRGYDFVKLACYDEMKVKAFAMIKPYRDRMEKVIDLLIWKDTEQAEVFTTVHTAWNNLIIDSAEITDEVIIFEARENWHEDKLKIDKSIFKTTISEIKRKNLQPDGSAKYVGKQQERLI